MAHSQGKVKVPRLHRPEIPMSPKRLPDAHEPSDGAPFRGASPMTRPRHGGAVPLSPVVIERAGGGLARVDQDPDPLRVLRGLAREGAEILGAERTAIWRMGPAGMPVRCLTRFHRSSRTHEDDVAAPNELGRETWRLLERLSILAMEDVRSGPPPTPVLGNYLGEAGIRSLLAVPIRHRGQLAGFLAFEEVEGPRRWTPRDREQAATLGFRLERHWGRVGTAVTPTSQGVTASIEPHAALEVLSRGQLHATTPAPSPTVAQPAGEPGPESLAGAGAHAEGAAEGAAPQQSPEPAARTGHVRIEECPSLRTACPRPGQPPAVTGPTGTEARSGAETTPAESPEPALAGAFGHRRELRARLQRLRTLERTGILGSRTARDVLHWLDVQQGTLTLLESHLGSNGAAMTLLNDAREALEQSRLELEHFLIWARNGLANPAATELNAMVGGLAVRLGKLTGDRVGLLYAPASEPVHMVAQPRLLQRCLEELVRNARAASVPGERVRVAVQRGDVVGGRQVARLIVEDRGNGIAPSNLPWIFEPWFTTRGEPSDGFGLPFVQAVAEGHGGWVDVTSTEGKGSRFVLNFPLAGTNPRDAPLTRDAEEASHGAAAAGDAPPLALVVEDEPHTARLLRRILEGAGFMVLVAEGSPEGIRLVREQAPSASLLVTERVLDDGGEGVDLLRTGRAIHPYLGGILLDRRLRSGAEDAVLARIRQAGRIPSDVALIPAPFHPDSLVSEARRLAVRRHPDPDPEPGSGATLH
ncbi:MAG: GAF domain-containing protein [Gemmatimonadales bacterium]|nr:MAG: GAF domain-containing protein [Gemmatimonadales bacterium]